jgi:hypothetical protein
MAADTEERVDGPTPNGGTYSIAYFRDADGNPCPKERSESMEICEFDEKDECIHRTYMRKPKATPDVFGEDEKR